MSHSTQDHSQGDTWKKHTHHGFHRWLNLSPSGLYPEFKGGLFYLETLKIIILLLLLPTWKYVSIVPLARSKNTPITQSHWTKWTPTGKEASTLWEKETKNYNGKKENIMKLRNIKRARRTGYICECVGLLCCAFCFIGRVTQGKNDWPFIQGSHSLDDIVGEQTSSSWHT